MCVCLSSFPNLILMSLIPCDAVRVKGNVGVLELELEIPTFYTEDSRTGAGFRNEAVSGVFITKAASGCCPFQNSQMLTGSLSGVTIVCLALVPLFTIGSLILASLG